MLRLYGGVIKAIQVPAIISKVGKAPILKEVLPEHVAFSFKITPNLQKQRKNLNSLVGYL
jgi:hypothetical protein